MHIYSGSRKNMSLAAPKGQATRPTSGRMRETLFNICQTYIDGALFLDLFAGSGAMGLEALSRGAKLCTFVDNSKESVRCIQENVRRLNFEDCAEVLFGNVFQMVAKLAARGKRYDIIYADPPYEASLKAEGETQSYGSRILTLIDASTLLAPSGMLFIEDSSTCKPEADVLHTLILKSTRQTGRSALVQYQKSG